MGQSKNIFPLPPFFQGLTLTPMFSRSKTPSGAEALKTLRELGDFVFPSSCRICRRRLESQSETYGLICEACEKTSSRLTAPFCATCRRVLPEGLEIYRKTEDPERSRGAATGSPCPSCSKPESIPPFDSAQGDPELVEGSGRPEPSRRALGSESAI